jgi:hypothetical protein
VAVNRLFRSPTVQQWMNSGTEEYVLKEYNDQTHQLRLTAQYQLERLVGLTSEQPSQELMRFNQFLLILRDEYNRLSPSM